MVPELNLSKTPTYEEKRTEIRKSAQDFKKAVENHKKETAFLRTFGTELSVAKRNKIRMTEYFETSEQCKERTFKDMEKIESGKTRQKNHVVLHILPWNEEECLEMVRSYPEGNKINFSELARHYGVKNNNNEFPKNGGQIVKIFLQENGINFDSLNYKNKSVAVHFRRKKRKFDGINVSIPTDVANTEVKEYLAKLINEGAYTIGDLIVPQKFEKLVLNADLTTEIKEFEIAGRKVPLSEIRMKQYINNKQFDRIFTESQIKETDWEEIVKELTRIDKFSKSDIYMDITTNIKTKKFYFYIVVILSKCRYILLLNVVVILIKYT